jgi:amino acid adenylation domain-containing protein
MDSVPTDMLRRFRQAAERAPDRTAVRGPGGELTFAELDAAVAELAGGLLARGAGRGSVVGVCLPRRVELIAVLLAVWRSGAAYVPLDPAYPPERRRFMADDSGARIIVAGAEDWRWARGEVVTPDELRGTGDAPQWYPDGLDLAYVIYTSGSTGRPKGVQITHGNVANLVAALEDAGVFAAEPRRVGWNASMSFDASVQQWTRVCRGDTMVLIDNELRAEPERMARYLREQAVTDLDVTPSHWQVLREPLRREPAGPVPLRLLVGGEAVPPAMWSGLATGDQRVEAVNVYGPTECTVDSTATWIRGDRPHIGRPMRGVRGYVLDELSRPVADGSPGELYLAGAGVGLGYVNRPGLTARTFRPDPFAADGSRMYRTGDRARWRSDGTLEYLGRVDRQVKLNGYRIELGEIEAVLAEHDEVVEAMVTVRSRPDPSLGQVLAAYYVPADDRAPAVRSLRQHLAARLPDFMIPASFVPLDAVPLSVSGKIDWAALPDPGHAARRPDRLDTLDGRPDTPDAGSVQQLIAQSWADVLGRERVLATDDFFDLGGHSLVALRVVARLKAQLGLAIPTRMVYTHPRLCDLAAEVEHLLTARRSAVGGT